MAESLKRRARRMLAAHSLRNTKCRAAVLQELIKKEKALSHSELEKVLTDFDRVTIYRTINSFLEKGLIHKVPDGSGAMRYALCPDNCSPEGHSHDHVHFKCRVCENTLCLDEHPVPEVNLPEGYQREETTMIVEGVCESCNS